MADIDAVAKALNRPLVFWSASEGATLMRPEIKAFEDCQDLAMACRTLRLATIGAKGKLNEAFAGAVVILRDPHTWPFEQDPVLLRAFRDLIQEAPKSGMTVIIIAPQFRPHQTIERMVTMMEYALPTSEDLLAIANNVVKFSGMKATVSEEVIRALSGLSSTETENALTLSYIETKKFDPAVIYREKIGSVRRSGLIEIVEPDPRGLDAIGGLNNLKTWIQRRRLIFSPKAMEYGIGLPKGVLLVGVPGTGKSLASKAIATALEVPMLRLDIGSLFNSLVGESEARTRDALKLAEAMAPCVLWVDEIDKGLAGAEGSGGGDSGVTRRIFGTIISWMQERRRPVFLVATANQVDGLPPELLRKGRFDEIFAVDLPTSEEREQILDIHLTRKKRNPKDFDLPAIAEKMKDFTGSEIEAVLDDALIEAYYEGREVETKDLIAAAGRTKPLAETAKEKITRIREWAETRARPASGEAPSPAKVVEESPVVGRRKLVPAPAKA